MRILPVGILSLVVFGAVAQETDIPFDKRLFEDRKVEFMASVKDIKQGDFHFFDGNKGDLNSSLYHYQRAQDFNPYSSVLNYKIGVCYLYSNQKFNALDYLKFAYKVNPEVDPNIKFYLAQAYHLNGFFDEAIQFYDEHKDAIREGDQIQRLYINKKITECRTGIKMEAAPIRVWIDNLGDSINTKFPEFSPVISADNRVLFFTGRRPDSKGDKTDLTGYHFEDVYVAKRPFGEDWGAAKNVDAPVNTKSHDATVGIAPDGKSLIIYRGINTKNGDIFITKENEDGTWQEPTSMGDNINTKFHESSASLSFDEKTLYFVSDQPGGFGQHDIYVSYWNEETSSWGPAENLGEVINSEFQEEGVFLHPDKNVLYFSSDDQNNMGGLDVYKSEWDEETNSWSKPENLGYPINTPDDDIYFVVTGDERYAYYSSYRQDGIGEKDIYKITFLGPRKEPLLAGSGMLDLKVPLTANPTLVNQFDDKDVEVIATTNNGNNTDAPISDKEIKRLLNEIKLLNQKIEAYKAEIAALKEQLANTTGNPDPEDSEEIKKLKREMAELDREIARLNQLTNNVTTDNPPNKTGRTDVFLLSGKVVDCVTKKGISANVSVVNSKTNEKVKDVYTGIDGTYTVALHPGVSYGLTASGSGYGIDSKKIETSKSEANTDRVIDFEICKASTGSSFTLRNIYFDFDRADLRIDANNELDKLVALMKEKPNMTIELGGHTDRRGDDSYNMTLSLQRANVAKDYLVRKGISASRITTKGYGETKPEIDGATISAIEGRKEKEEAHQKNRRTTVTVLSE